MSEELIDERMVLEKSTRTLTIMPKPSLPFGKRCMETKVVCGSGGSSVASEFPFPRSQHDTRSRPSRTH